MEIQRPEVSKVTILKASKIISERINGDAGEIADCYCPNVDGYGLAKKLEGKYYWDIDFQVVEALEELSHEIGLIHKEACMQWVIDSKIKPPLEIGTAIKEGIIKGIYEYDAAMYTVTKYGETMKNRHQIIKFENAVAI